MTIFYNRQAATRSHTITLKRFFGNLLGILLALSVLNSCEEDPSKIGGSILPLIDFDNVSATDTFTVDMFTMFTDTIRSLDPYSSFLGSIDDPIFGTTTSSAVTQLWLYSSWPGAGVSSVDSVMFYFQVKGVLGEMSDGGTLNIYEIDEFLDIDSVYYVNRDVPVKGLLASLPVSGITGDSLQTYKLDVSVGELLLSDTTKLILTSDTSVVDFREFFNGLYFEYVQSVNDHMLDVDIISGRTFINVHYTTSADVAAAYTFSTNTKCVRYNRFIHDFGTADADIKINHINDGFKDTLTYVQSFQGVYARVEIPGLEGLKEMMPLGINKARLIFPAFFNEDYFPEENIISLSLYARYTNNDGIRAILPDYELGAAFFDGSYYGLDYEFRINIVNFIQMYLEGEIAEPAFEIFLPVISNNNLIFRSNNPLNPVRLELVYSLVK